MSKNIADQTESRRRNVGAIIFFLLMIGTGAFFAYALWWQDVRTGERILSDYVETQCVVLETWVDVETTIHSGSSTERDTSDLPKSYSYLPEARIRYTVDGRTYEAWTFDKLPGSFSEREDAEEQLAPFAVNQQYPCWYDPEDPMQVVLVRWDSYDKGYVGVVAASIFAGIGLLGLLFTLIRW